MTKVSFYNLRFAGVSDESLLRIAAEYEAWHDTGHVPEDALLRERGMRRGPGPVGMITEALECYREICHRFKFVPVEGKDND